MKKSVLLLILVASIGCGKSSSKEESAREWNQKYGAQMCDKMVECSKKMLEKIPASYRKMAEAKMPTKEACIAEQNKKRVVDESITLTEDEIAAARKCMEDMIKASCEDIQTMKVTSCNEYATMMGKKTKSASQK